MGQGEGIAVALRLRRGPLSFAAMSLQSEPGPRGSPRGHGGRPSRQESAQLSDRILDVATALFLSDGFGATSIEGIAKRAGISKRTFYHRFTGKEMLFEAVVRRLIERWTPSFDAALAWTCSFWMRVSKMTTSSRNGTFVWMPGSKMSG